MFDIDVVRREAMGLLEVEAGGPAAAARRAGMSYTQWANLRSGALDSKTGKPRGMRKETARKIEAAFGKPDGWLDAADLVEPNYARDVALARVLEAWNVAEDAQRDEVRAWADSVLRSGGR